MADESTPIENVLEVEQGHSAEAEQALAELNGTTTQTPTQPAVAPPQASMYRDMGGSDDEDDEIMDESAGESMMDFWIQIVMTAATVSALVFVFFSPKVRVMLEPVIGSGYMALGIRAIIIGIMSLMPRLVLM